jgi:hypothetical protein
LVHVEQMRLQPGGDRGVRGSGEERWLAKFGQSDKWKICLKAAKMPRIRSEYDETSTADA